MNWESILSGLMSGWDSTLNSVMLGLVAVVSAPFLLKIAFRVGAAGLRRLQEIL
jgi:hypothetical protein